jgi:hypothetical protein
VSECVRENLQAGEGLYHLLLRRPLRRRLSRPRATGRRRLRVHSGPPLRRQLLPQPSGRTRLLLPRGGGGGGGGGGGLSVAELLEGQGELLSESVRTVARVAADPLLLRQPRRRRPPQLRRRRRRARRLLLAAARRRLPPRRAG